MALERKRRKSCAKSKNFDYGFAKLISFRFLKTKKRSRERKEDGKGKEKKMRKIIIKIIISLTGD